MIDIVKKSFVATWLDANPGYAGQELRAGGEDLAPTFAKWWPDGRAETNVKTIVATPAGDVLHVIPGFVRAETLVHELEFALDVAKAMDAAGSEPAARRAALAKAHAEHRAALERRWGKLDPGTDPFATTVDADDWRLDRFPQIQMKVDELLAAAAQVDEADTASEGGSPVARLAQSPQKAKPVARALPTASAITGGVSAVAPPPPPPIEIRRPVVQPPAMLREFWKIARAAPLYRTPGLRGKRGGAVARPAARPRSGGGGAPRGPSLDDIESARRASAASDAVDRALAAFARRAADPVAWKRERASVKAAGTLAWAPLLEATLSRERAPAAFEVLRATTGELIPDDADAWSRFLLARSEAVTESR